MVTGRILILPPIAKRDGARRSRRFLARKAVGQSLVQAQWTLKRPEGRAPGAVRECACGGFDALARVAFGTSFALRRSVGGRRRAMVGGPFRHEPVANRQQSGAEENADETECQRAADDTEEDQ